MYGLLYRTEATHWWYRVRRTIVTSIVAKHVKKASRPLRILDVGCGTGALLSELQTFGTVDGLDKSADAVAYCATRGLAAVVVGDAERLPYQDETFDVVIALDVLEHLPDDSIGSRELARVLKKGGIAIVAVPAFQFLWGITDTVSHHYRRYRLKEITRVVQDAGLVVTRSTYFNTFLFPAIAAVRLSARLVPHDKSKSTVENEMGGALGNAIFYKIFRLESALLPYINFPFGVSALVVGEKP